MISKHTKKFSTLVQKVDKYIYLFFVLIFIFILAFIVFFKTPMISWIGIAGNNKWVTTEDIIENVFVKENNISTEDYIFKYLISKNKIVELSYDKIINTIVKVDSLSKEVELWKLYATNIRQITTGKKEGLKSETLIDSIRTTKNLTQARSSIDSILRKEVFKEKDIFDKSNFTVEGIKIYPPMDGELTTHFNYSDKISGVTISTVKMTPVISVAEGTIILSMWTPEDGNIISIQHPDNITSTRSEERRVGKEC